MDYYIGEIRIFGFNYPPKGWAFCSGQLLSIQQNQALFSILGTTYGGNGTNTFALPDLRGRFPMHWGIGGGLSSRQIGQNVGVENVTLLPPHLPQHNHVVNAAALGNAPLAQPGPSALLGSDPTRPYSDSSGNAVMSQTLVATAGANQPHSNMPPFLVMNFAIALMGIFPSRN